MNEQVHFVSSLPIFAGTFCTAHVPYEYVTYGGTNMKDSVTCEYCKTKYIIKDYDDYKCPYCGAPNRGVSTY